MPLRKHEMVYVFYKRLPMYDLSSHKHKFKNKKEDNGINRSRYEPPLPTSIIKKDIYGFDNNKKTDFKGRNSSSVYDPPLPTSLLEFKSTRGKHRTEKPISLMSWILKYYSKENDNVLDSTMGSGSMGVACRKMKRKFIGIEMDDEIFKTAVKRISLNIND